MNGMMSHLPVLLVLIPLLALLIMAFVPGKRESLIAAIATTGVGADVLLYLLMVYQWGSGGFAPLVIHTGSLTLSPQYIFGLEWYFDTVSAVFFGLTSLITMLIFTFSKYYMHRDPGFSRYFGTILLFFVGLILVILSGNFDVLFLGWEWIGMSSFLLIAYYRDRFLPVRNALKVFSLYRIADLSLVVAIWMGHQMIENVHGFSQLSDIAARHGNEFTMIGLLFLIVAVVKSAQFPFSYWLPRAMEGPTTSSAIFYGALSVHMGLFVLLRTYPLWEGSMTLRVAVAAIGVLTAFIATAITRVQSSIKTQIAYASVTQIGIMFVEVAAGMHSLALLHMISNAFLRTYQLLISPSIVGYLIHDQFYYFVPPSTSIPNTLAGRLRATIFVLSIKEWDMNANLTRYVWKPLKDIGRILSFLDSIPEKTIWLALAFTGAGVVAIQMLGMSFSPVPASISVVMSILFFIRAYSTKHAPSTGWNLIMMGHLCVMLFFSFASGSSWRDMALYAGGILAAFGAGHLCLGHLESCGESALLADYHGHAYEYPRLASVFFIVCLGYMAFPVTLSFLGQDLLLRSIPIRSIALVVLFGVAYLLAGTSIMRLYAKVFFGPHKKRYHEIAYKSA